MFVPASQSKRIPPGLVIVQNNDVLVYKDRLRAGSCEGCSMLTVKVLGDYIDGMFQRPRGAARKIVSRDPGDSGYRIGSFPLYPEHVDIAVTSARRAYDGWRRLDPEERADALRKFSAEVINHRQELKETIAAETGKPLWEAEEEVLALDAQVEIEIREGIRFVSSFKVGEIRHGVSGSCRYRPLGVVVVLGSAISPAHLACSQIIPALLSGNSVVFKPSKLVPAVGQVIAKIVDAIDLPPGVFNLVQGDADAGMALAAHRDVDAVQFVGSNSTGRRILQATVDQPHKLVALQTSGMNVALVLADADLMRATYETVTGAYLTTGQRYTSTRIILVEKSTFARFVESFVETTKRLNVGYAFDPGVFMGPMLSAAARDRVIDLQERLQTLGARSLLPARPLKPGRPGSYLSPAVLAMDWPADTKPLRPDGPLFGPVTILVPIENPQQGLAIANSLEYGFSASVFSENANRFSNIADELQFGVINFNVATTEVSMRLPLGGTKRCGNHRPAGVFSQRNCTFPVASLSTTHPFEPEHMRPPFPTVEPKPE
jgi:succinylglutamic semialdehyde dehydrogenase